MTMPVTGSTPPQNDNPVLLKARRPVACGAAPATRAVPSISGRRLSRLAVLIVRRDAGVVEQALLLTKRFEQRPRRLARGKFEERAANRAELAHASARLLHSSGWPALLKSTVHLQS